MGGESQQKGKKMNYIRYLSWEKVNPSCHSREKRGGGLPKYWFYFNSNSTLHETLPVLLSNLQQMLTQIGMPSLL